MIVAWNCSGDTKLLRTSSILAAYWNILHQNRIFFNFKHNTSFFDHTKNQQNIFLIVLRIYSFIQFASYIIQIYIFIYFCIFRNDRYLTNIIVSLPSFTRNHKSFNENTLRSTYRNNFITINRFISSFKSSF